MTETLTEKQAWYKVAETLADPTSMFSGICLELRVLFHNGDIAYDQYCEMKEYCQSHIVPEEAWEKYWAYPPGQEREARILAALFFAEMA